MKLDLGDYVADVLWSRVGEGTRSFNSQSGAKRHSTVELIQLLDSLSQDVFRMEFEVNEEAVLLVLKALSESWRSCESMGIVFGGGAGFQISSRIRLHSHPQRRRQR